MPDDDRPDNLFTLPDFPIDPEDTVEFNSLDGDDEGEERTVESCPWYIYLCPHCKRAVASIQIKCFNCNNTLTP
jgi:hypothetical protein